MLTRGNGKLGRGRIWGFGLPSRATCPGQTPACSAHCYSAQIEAYRPSVRQRYQSNYALSRRSDFADRVCAFIRRRGIEVVRVHTAGDFDTLEYAQRWLSVMQRLPGTRFYLYTRSWRIPRIRRVLTSMARCSNVRVWFSLDRDTGSPGRVPAGVQLAWLMTEEADIPDRGDLIFRTQSLRRRIRKRVALPNGAETLVCPTENGVTGHRTDCERCGICWEHPFQPQPQPQNQNGRVTLPMRPDA